MKKLITNLFIFGILVLSLSACVENTIKLSEKDSGSSIKAKKGDIIAVSLAGNPTTGYIWGIDSVDSAILKQTGTPLHKADTKLVGAPGKTTFVFRAVSKGTTELKLRYYRPWEKDVIPVKTFEVSVKVR